MNAWAVVVLVGAAVIPFLLYFTHEAWMRGYKLGAQDAQGRNQRTLDLVNMQNELENYAKDRFDEILKDEGFLLAQAIQSINQSYRLELNARINYAKDGKNHPPFKHPCFVGVSDKGENGLKTIEVCLTLPTLTIEVGPRKETLRVEIFSHDDVGMLRPNPVA